jgi:hypothetical protein
VGPGAPQFPRADIASAAGANSCDALGWPITAPIQTVGEVSWQNPVSGNWTTAADWSTGAVPTASSDVTIAVSGSYTVTINSAAAAHSLTIDDAGATVLDSGTLTLGTTLSVAAGTLSLASGGVISGGTISIGDAGTLLSTGGTLAGMTIEGPLTLGSLLESLTLSGTTHLTGPAGSGAGTINLTGEDNALSVYGKLVGTRTINETGDAASLTLYGNHVLSGGTLNIGDASASDYLTLANATKHPATLTLASNYTLDQVGTGSYLLVSVGDSYYGMSDVLINDGKIVAAQQGGRFDLGIDANGGYIVNAGSIAVSNGDTMALQAISISNSGTMSVTGADSVLSFLSNWTNTGSIIDSGGTLNIGGTFTTAALASVTENGGIVNIAGLLENTGTLSIGTGTGLAALGLINNGRIEGGTISDAGNGLAVSYGTLANVTYQGPLNIGETNATLGLDGNTTLTGVGGNGAGTINLTGQDSDLLVSGALIGAGIINDTGVSSTLWFFGNHTLDNATLNIGESAVALSTDVGGSATLTLGSNFTINHVGGAVNSQIQFFDSSGDALINQGVIINDQTGGGLSIGTYGGTEVAVTNQGKIEVANGGAISISAASFINSGTIDVSGAASDFALYADWTNAGVISVSDGATLTLGGTFTSTALATITGNGGTIDIAGLMQNSGTLAIGAGSKYAALELSYGGTVMGGVISDAGSGLSSMEGQLSGLTYEGPLDFTTTSGYLNLTNVTLTGAGGSGAGTLTIGGTLTNLAVYDALTGAATINDTGDQSTLTLWGNQTLDNGVLNVGGAGACLVYCAFESMVTLGSNFLLTQVGSSNVDYIVLGGATEQLTNQGTIAADQSGGRFYIGSEVEGSTGGTLTNQGSIVADNGGSVIVNAGNFTNLAGTTLTGGAYDVGANSVILLDYDTSIATDQADITLAGAGSVLETGEGTLDSQLSSIGAAGALILLDGRDFTATANGGNFTDGGVLVLGGVAFSAATLDISAGAMLAGSGSVAGAVITAGSIASSGGTLAFLGPVANTGTIEADSGLLSIMSKVTGAGTLALGATGTLSLLDGAANGQTVEFLSGTGLLDLTHPANFDGAIAGFSNADTIDLLNKAATGFTYTGGVLTVTDGSETVASLRFDGSYTQANFMLGSDGHGGTFITFQ